MTSVQNKDEAILKAITEIIIEDIENLTCEEILNEAKQCKWNIEELSNSHERLLNAAILDAKKIRYQNIKNTLERTNFNSDSLGSIKSDQGNNTPLSLNDNSSEEITLAARNETEMSDSDKRSMMEDLKELGVFLDDSD